NKKKILILGGTGFIGQNLVRYFAAQGHFEVHATHFQRPALNIQDVKFHRCDLREAAQVSELVKGIDIVIQAAATTSGSKDIVNSPSLHVTDNAVMNSLIIKAVSEQKVSHLVFFSCTVMYPNSQTPVTESGFEPDLIFHKYFGVAWTKVYVEKVCEFFSKTGSTKFTVIRHSNIYGPYDKYDLEKSHVFGATITKVMQGTKEVSVWGRGEETRDFLYVDDLVSFVDTALKKQTTAYELVNVGLGSSISIADFVKKVVSLSQKNLEIKFDVDKPTIPTHLVLDISKTKSLFNWTPEVDLDAGIKKTLNWYRENIAK
ncbi:MAG: NAD-dependent epimerase/dehydratase family protein, partial [Pseudobdellovibrio sp.]